MQRGGAEESVPHPVATPTKLLALRSGFAVKVREKKMLERVSWVTNLEEKKQTRSPRAIAALDSSLLFDKLRSSAEVGVPRRRVSATKTSYGQRATEAQKLKPVERPRGEALRSPASALFDTTYQGGVSVEVFSAGGSNPTSNWKMSGAVQRVYDKSVKGYIFHCEGGPSAKMQLPKDERRLLGLVQPYLVLQLLVPASKPFALELSVSDTTRARRRVLLSTSFREPVRTSLHTRLPLAAIHRDIWLNLTFDLVALVAANFPGATFAHLESSRSARCARFAGSSRCAHRL